MRHQSQRQSWDTKTTFAIGPKGEARTFQPHAPSGITLRNLSTWDGFNYLPWLGPEDTELHVPLVPKAKLDNKDHMHQRQSLDIRTTCAIYWTCAQFGGGSFKVVTRTVPECSV